jgi:hypothetical protein
MKLQNRKTVKLKKQLYDFTNQRFYKNLLPIKSIHRIINSCENKRQTSFCK